MPNSVVILEDEALIAWDIEEELLSLGWGVLGTAANNVKALALIAQEKPQAAVLDINLGDETSFAVARECLAQDIAVVFLSGESADARPEDLRHLTICPKPVDYRHLHAALQQAVGES